MLREVCVKRSTASCLRRVRQVVVDHDVHLKLTPAGFIRNYSKKAYKDTYGREGTEDGLQLQEVKLPDGTVANCFKASCLVNRETCSETPLRSQVAMSKRTV